MLRQEILQWRFYHHFRTDAESPIRQPQVGVRTPVLSHDGRDLAAAIQTILEIGREDFVQHVNAAFPGDGSRSLAASVSRSPCASQASFVR